MVDTGPLVAAALVDDPDHVACAAWFEQATGSLVVPDLVIPEVCYLLASGARTHVEVAFLHSLGVPWDRCWTTAASGKGWWRMSHTPAAQQGMSNAWFQAQGLTSLLDRYLELTH